jgi:hypothetical protein
MLLNSFIKDWDQKPNRKEVGTIFDSFFCIHLGYLRIFNSRIISKSKLLNYREGLSYLEIKSHAKNFLFIYIWFGKTIGCKVKYWTRPLSSHGIIRYAPGASKLHCN